MDEVLVDWTTASGGGKVSVLYVADTTTEAFRGRLGTFLSGINSRLHTTTKWSIRGSGRKIDSATGTLLGEWIGSAAITGTGTGTGEPLPDACQALIRWNTGVVVAGRFARGRTFIPGLTTAGTTGGNLTPAVQSAIQTGATTLLAGGPSLLVWHRPVGGAGGTNNAVTSSTVWNELAVLRRRRGTVSGT